MIVSKNTLISLAAITVLSGCSTIFGSSESAPVTVVTPPPSKLSVPEGAYEYVWEEPKVALVEVGPGLDHQGIYYHPKHYEIQPMKQGKWQYYRRAED